MWAPSCEPLTGSARQPHVRTGRLIRPPGRRPASGSRSAVRPRLGLLWLCLSLLLAQTAGWIHEVVHPHGSQTVAFAHGPVRGSETACGATATAENAVRAFFGTCAVDDEAPGAGPPHAAGHHCELFHASALGLALPGAPPGLALTSGSSLPAVSRPPLRIATAERPAFQSRAPPVALSRPDSLPPA